MNLMLKRSKTNRKEMRDQLKQQPSTLPGPTITWLMSHFTCWPHGSYEALSMMWCFLQHQKERRSWNRRRRVGYTVSVIGIGYNLDDCPSW